MDSVLAAGDPGAMRLVGGEVCLAVGYRSPRVEASLSLASK